MIAAADFGEPKAPSTADLEVRLFGRLAILARGQPLPRTRTRKDAWLISLLVLHAVDAPIEREWLAATLWPETAESGALYNLRRSLGALRDALGPESARILSPTPRTLQLNLDGAECDLLRFDRAMRRGERGLADAVEAYTGPLLLGCMEEWVIEPRSARLRAVLGALESLAATAEARGERATATDRLRRVLDLDPLRETALLPLMKLLSAEGNHGAAAELFRHFRLRLLHEANAEPNAETIQLNRQILLETHRTASAKYAFEADASTPALPVAEAEAASTPLHSEARPLIGRTDDVDEVRRLLQVHRLVTLTGSGGIGKTTLAVHVAEDVAANYPDGVHFVDLAPRSDEDSVAPTIAAAVGALDRPELSAVDALTDHLRARGMLLLLDNCEHILPECARVVAHLLRACPSIRFLATSREPLRVLGEAAWRVPSLSSADSRMLFEQRASLARPSFRPTSSVRPSIDHICERLDGIPLAIEMAAAWIRAMTAAQIAERLDNAFLLLARADGADQVPRHRTLRATLDWSYDLLTERERTLLARLSIFSGGWALEAAEAVCTIDGVPSAIDVLELLVALVDRSLVIYHEDADGTGRYRFLETTRVYAAERLVETERQQLQTALTRHLLQLAETAKTHWDTAAEAAWLARLEREIPNIRVALGGPMTAEIIDFQLDMRLATALLRLWWRHAHIVEGLRFLCAALSRHDSAAQTETRAAALNACGALANYHRDTRAAFAYHSEALAIRRALGDKRGMAVSLHNLASLQGNDADKAIAYLTECVALYRELGDDNRAEKNQLFLDGWLAGGNADLSAAIERHEKRVAAAVLRGDQAEEASLRAQIGFAAQRDGRRELALDSFRRCLTLLSAVQDLIALAEALEGAAGALLALGNAGALPRLYGAADRLRSEIACPMLAANRDNWDRNVDEARLSLGAADFEAAWHEGRAMTVDQAVALAMAD